MGREITISRLFFIGRVISVCILAVIFLDGRTNAASWTQNGFDNQNVSYVKTNQQKTDQIAVVADNKLYLSGDGGLFWRYTAVPQTPVMVAFDPVRAGHIFAGTNRGIFYSSDYGLTWQDFGIADTKLLITVGLAADDDYIYASMYRGSGTQYRLYRMLRSGDTQLVSFGGRPGYLLSAQDQLFIGNSDGVFRSFDKGDSWIHLGGGPNTTRIVAKEASIWQLSANGLFRSSDGGASWLQQHNRDNLLEHNAFDRRFSGLVINKGKAFFGASSSSRKGKDVVRQEGSAIDRLELGMVVTDLGDGNNKLWAATSDGLWVSTELVATEASVKRPVIIIPGIMGSWQVRGEWKLDPIMQTYDNLWNGLKEHGFKENSTLFAFPYQWRQSNVITARQLDQRITEAKIACSCPKVDLIGHSMGGLVARQYVQSDYYDGDVEYLIQIGTPNAGSPKSYITWESGDLQQPWRQEILANLIFRIEAAEKGYLSLARYIREHVNSLEQLLPTYSYLEDRVYPIGYPRNVFLEELNSPGELAELSSKVKLLLFGSDRQNTLISMRVGDQNPSAAHWTHGRPVQKFYGSGDGTVPITSLELLRPRNAHMVRDHGGMVTEAKDLIAIRLMGGYRGLTLDEPAVRKYLMAYVLSPVRIELISPSGKVVNDATNNIPGAFFTGSNEEVQFVTIPNPEEGQYKIHLTGKGSGNYGVGVAIVEEGAEGPVVSELSHSTEPTALDGYIYDTASQSLAMEFSIRDSAVSPIQVDIEQNLAAISASYFNDPIVGVTGSKMIDKKHTAESLSGAGPGNGDSVLLLIGLWSAILALALWYIKKQLSTT